MNHDDYEYEEEIQLLPERNWWQRASPILTIPREIAFEYFEVKRRFGIDVANIILYVYKTWGARVAKILANKIMTYDSFIDMVEFLEKKAELFDEKSRKILSGLIYRFKYDYYFDNLLSIVSNHEHTCPEVRKYATEIFHTLAKRGLFYDVECIVEYALVLAGCEDRVKHKCKNIVRIINQYYGGRK